MRNYLRLLLVVGTLSVAAAGAAQEGPRADRPAGGARRPQHVASYAGNVLIRTQGVRVLVMVDTSFDRTAQSDGVVDQWFVLETATPLLMPINEHLGEASLLYSAEVLQVTSLDRSFEFTLHGDTGSADGLTTRIAGVGLSHHKAEKTNIRIADEVRRGRVSATCYACNALDPDPGSGDGGGTTCSSGGPGSTQCSATRNNLSCSITCAAGYYACCNYGTSGAPSCRCVSG